MNNERDAILQVVDHYVQGSFRGDRALLESAFAADAKMHGIMGGRYVTMSAAAFIDGICQSPSMADSGVDFRVETEVAGVYGDIAAAVVHEHNFGGTTDFVDMFQLVKNEGAWRIVSKTFCTADL